MVENAMDLSRIDSVLDRLGSAQTGLPITWAAALNMIPNCKTILKYCHNPDADPSSGEPQDIWPATIAGSLQYNFLPSSAVTCEIFSSDAQDSFGGARAERVRVFGLDANFNEIEEDIDLNGTSPVSLVRQYRRIYRARVIQGALIMAGQDQYWLNAGDIVIRETATAVVGAVILTNFGQTTQSNYTVPAGFSGIVATAATQTLGSDNATVALVAGEVGMPFRTALFGTSSNTVTHMDGGVATFPLSAGETIRMICFPSLPNVTLAGWYTLLLVKE